MVKIGFVLMFLAVTVPFSVGSPILGSMISAGTSMAMSGVNLVHQGNKAVLGGAASMTSNIPIVGSAVGSANELYRDITTIKGVTRRLGASFAHTLNMIGRDKLVQMVQMFGDLINAAIDLAKQILMQRLASVPLVGEHLKSADDILQVMLKYGGEAGLPTDAIQAVYTAFLLVVNGLLSAVTQVAPVA